ncbi:hypothetical protein B0H19DRAFT_1230936 [Mycena capillaripes]|nr:hypothetical protein B0H19DRAFT_1230936 [Mycena capillaripes]
MTGPRPSVLQLFDPLSSRDAHSPDSDKENSYPDSDFFPKTYVQHPGPVRLTRRLVDVGDVTVDAGGYDDGLVEDEEDEDDTVGFHPPPSPRTPLADVTFDRERTPMRSKVYRRKANEDSSPAPDSYAFESAVNVVNVSGTTFRAQANPSVVICPPEEPHSNPVGETDVLSTSLATLSLATPTGSLIADTTMAFPTPSEASTSLHVPTIQPPPVSMTSFTSFNLDCSSADLQSSFALHMNMNSDESFDLLNDRISFLGQSDGESFDMGRELGSISEPEETEGTAVLAEFNADPELCLVAPFADNMATRPAGSPPRSGSPQVQFSDFPQESSITDQQDLCGSSAMPIQPSITPPLPPVFVAPPPPASSLPEPPRLVPALKIVKRKRPDTTTVPKAAVETAPLDNVVSPNSPATDNGASTRTASSMIPSVGRYVMEGPGPWRVPISSSDKEKEKVHHKPVAGSILSGPRRVPLPNEAPIPAPAPAIASTKALPRVAAQLTAAIKRPLRVVPPNGSASGLPRAVSASRLPMPKSKIPVAPAGTGLPRRRVV